MSSITFIYRNNLNGYFALSMTKINQITKLGIPIYYYRLNYIFTIYMFFFVYNTRDLCNTIRVGPTFCTLSFYRLLYL